VLSAIDVLQNNLLYKKKLMAEKEWVSLIWDCFWHRTVFLSALCWGNLVRGHKFFYIKGVHSKKHIFR
jgi:hypothetical protein